MENETIELVQRLETIKTLCAGKRTLHLGCTNYPYTSESIEKGRLLHLELESLCSELYGIDSDREGLGILQAEGVENLFQADLERLESLELDKTFEVIIAGEIIEHLTDPGQFLRGIRRFCGPGSKIVITTINAYCAFRFAQYALRGRGGRNEPVHPDHVSYYSYSTLKHLIEQNDLRLDDIVFYDLGNEHRLFNRWYLNLFNDVSVRFTPQLADGLIAVCSVPATDTD